MHSVSRGTMGIQDTFIELILMTVRVAVWGIQSHKVLTSFSRNSQSCRILGRNKYLYSSELDATVQFSSVQFNDSVVSDSVTPMDCYTPGFPVHHPLPELAQAHIHQVSDAIQPSHPLSSPTLPAFNLAQHQGLFQWLSSSHQVAKVLELQYRSFQWIFRVDFL